MEEEEAEGTYRYFIRSRKEELFYFEWVVVGGLKLNQGKSKMGGYGGGNPIFHNPKRRLIWRFNLTNNYQFKGFLEQLKPLAHVPNNLSVYEL